MREPRREPPNPDQLNPMAGVMSAFVPRGAVGILAGMFLLVVLAVASGMAHGVWLALAIVALVLLALGIAQALKTELRRDGRRPRRQTVLPDDAELSDAERREAMRRLSDEGPRP